MNNFFSRLFRHNAGKDAAPMMVDRAFVSEFTHFMDDYLQQHPNVVDDQNVGRHIYWEKNVDLAELEKAEKDSVPDDGYGFYASAWNGKH